MPIEGSDPQMTNGRACKLSHSSVQPTTTKENDSDNSQTPPDCNLSPLPRFRDYSDVRGVVARRLLDRPFHGMPQCGLALLFFFLWHCDDGGICSPSVAQVAAFYGISERIVQTYSKQLAQMGWIKRTMGGKTRGETNVYQLLPDGRWWTRGPNSRAVMGGSDGTR